MTNNFTSISPYKLKDNFFDALDNGWMLITAGNIDKLNTMTASWGGFGILWNKPVSFIFIRPQRYTFEFVEKNDYYTLCFFDEEWHSALKFCGSKSGRDYDKVKETGLTPIKTPNGIAFKQARLIIECKKLYADNLNENNFLDMSVALKNYPTKDYHKFAIGEIMNVFVKNEK